MNRINQNNRKYSKSRNNSRYYRDKAIKNMRGLGSIGRIRPQEDCFSTSNRKRKWRPSLNKIFRNIYCSELRKIVYNATMFSACLLSVDDCQQHYTMMVLSPSAHLYTFIPSTLFYLCIIVYSQIIKPTFL